jgi:hypothetical protein
MLAAFERSFITCLLVLVGSFVVSWCSTFEQGFVSDVLRAKVLQ